MDLPPDARRMGASPRWIGYVGVDDVDAVADRIVRLGGAVYVPPTNTNIGRISVVADPQTATLALVTGLKSGEQPAEPDEPGRVGWHELLASDWKKAFAFYSELFGWRKADAEFGSTDRYQMFSAGGQTIGGMFTKRPMEPVPFWLYYFNVDDVDCGGGAGDRRRRSDLRGTDRIAGRQLDCPLQGSGRAQPLRFRASEARMPSIERLRRNSAGPRSGAVIRRKAGC